MHFWVLLADSKVVTNLNLSAVPLYMRYSLTNPMCRTVPLGNKASGSVSGLAFQIGSDTIRLRLKVCLLEIGPQQTVISYFRLKFHSRVLRQ